MAKIRFDGVSKSFGANTALSRLDLSVEEGEFLSLLGPSGCGKTTALRLVAGFAIPTSGSIFIDGTDISRLAPYNRNIGMVFQDYALFPHMTVAENVGFGLQERKWPRGDIARRVHELLDLVKLPGAERRYPSELSGGQQQRVALARALAFNPRVLLMDEPFGALDLKLRDSMQSELVQIQRKLKITTIFVTHDQDEAMAMSHRIAVMGNGRIQQLGSPEDIYNRPVSIFVADFIGKINLISADIAELEKDKVVLRAGGGSIFASVVSWAMVGLPVKAGVRPESILLHPFEASHIVERKGTVNFAKGVVVATRFAGSAHFVEVETELFGRLTVKAALEDFSVAEGTCVSLSWPSEKTFLLRE